jgi:hypothetical protein
MLVAKSSDTYATITYASTYTLTTARCHRQRPQKLDSYTTSTPLLSLLTPQTLESTTAITKQTQAIAIQTTPTLSSTEERTRSTTPIVLSLSPFRSALKPGRDAIIRSEMMISRFGDMDLM